MATNDEMRNFKIYVYKKIYYRNFTICFSLEWGLEDYLQLIENMSVVYRKRIKCKVLNSLEKPGLGKGKIF